ncbi:MAG TPA: DUF5686 and carboxypeptidase regulatory-like domain-containing protein [Flavobacteriaceae bacterium]|nr:carboxypeptidase-like regulatory domain-containing protein [Flavobacteriaceae bacterium]MCB9213797.1 carboxypeptidase-like regulatory domain-containing protein [Alteromonas sp.]HPF10872.1 DUF5686 and carboxypeptidase regulatory-like domain-containing protein [Flavobacteriaceae bacterium]HQU22173.1 DUF5686 and carboxypeptidase regulatory-like domain-containing protein [Flavobacteriaceae bacterium]HQU66519.1 DUF5686 and carboxypeptidase regulatory-like domain-containing protein [Flavobacteriac
MKPLFTLCVLFCHVLAWAQLTGTVTDTQGHPLPFVNIYVEGTYQGTTSNELGHYALDLPQEGPHTVVFQFLGYGTVKQQLTIDAFPQVLNISLTETTVSLDEVVINATEDPAYRIIRATIAQRKANLERLSAFTADFYSRGIWRVDSVPKKVLGQEVGDFDGALDSTRTGIIYLSETISTIAYRHPNDFKEHILASKVSGNDNGFSFNSAQEANFSFYENTLNLNTALVSPIANNALSYYRFQLDGVFYEGNKLINKIQVIPKRPNDRVWRGTLYIVEDDWQLYGLELTTTGASIQVPFIKELVFTQNFKYDAEEAAWVKIFQSVDFSFGFFGFNGDGRFVAVYSGYDFHPAFDGKSFGNEVLYFEPEANKKDSLYWDEKRPVALTDEETNDYSRKDSIQTLRKSQVYLDSVDAKNNRFKLLSPLFGYSYKNSFRQWELTYEAPLPGVQFNTVQGWNGGAGLTFFKWYDDYRSRWFYANVSASYGISEDRLRWRGSVTKKFNNGNDFQLSAFGGSEVRQFNSDQPITPLINSIATLFWERNYMKLYGLNYGGLAWSQELFNGLRTTLSVSYQQRQPLFNTTDYVILPSDRVDFSSNNPLVPTDFVTPAFQQHELVKTFFRAQVTFGQKYMTYPDGKFNVRDANYPRFTFELENALGASETGYNFTQVRARLQQEVEAGSLGTFHYHLKGGTFLHGEEIAFVDYQHFNGNQTRVGTNSTYTNVFNLLPYYALSTNKSYLEVHAEHHFNGWVLSKIPGINQLGFSLVVGGHLLGTEERNPYSEVSLGLDNLGWGKYRLLRLDYVRSFYGDRQDGAFVFGLKFLDLFE